MFRPFSLAFAAAMALLFVSQASGQAVVQGGGAGGARVAYSQNSQSLMYLLYYPQFQKEIEISDEQKTELQKIQADMQTKMTESYKTLNEKQEGDALQRQQKYMPGSPGNECCSLRHRWRRGKFWQKCCRAGD